MYCSTNTQRKRRCNDLSYTIPRHLLREYARNIAVVHAYTGTRGLEMTVIQRRVKKGKKGQKRNKQRKERKEKRNKNFMHARRAQASPGGKRLLFAGGISPMICLGDGPTEGRHDKTRRRARKNKTKQNKTKEESSDIELEKTNKHFYVQLVGRGRHKRPEGRQK